MTRSLAAVGMILAVVSCSTNEDDAKKAAADAGADVGDDAADGGRCMGGSAVSKGPWVLRVDGSSAVLRWEACREGGKTGVTLTPEAGGAAQQLDATVKPFVVNNTYTSLNPDAPPDEAGTYYMHELSLTGLSPATCYGYALAEDASLKGRFCTARAPGDGFKFMAVGDTNPGLGTTPDLLKAVAGENYDFTVHAGDIQYYASVLETWQSWFPLMMPMFAQGAFYPSIGNHEMEKPDELEQYVFRFFGGAGFDGTDEYFRFQSGGVWFFSIDSEIPMGPGSPQFQWFTTQLADAATQPGYRFGVVFLHRPFLTCGDTSQKDGDRQAYQPLFEQYGVELVLQGHMHGYERFEVPHSTDATKTITYLTVAGGGGALGNIDENIDRPTCAMRVAKGKYYHVAILDVAAGKLSGKSVDKTGATQDSFEKAVP